MIEHDLTRTVMNPPKVSALSVLHARADVGAVRPTSPNGRRLKSVRNRLQLATDSAPVPRLGGAARADAAENACAEGGEGQGQTRRRHHRPRKESTFLDVLVKKGSARLGSRA